MERAEADVRDRKQRLEATKITSDVNARRVEQLRGLRVKVPGTGTGKDLDGAKEVSGRLWLVEKPKERNQGPLLRKRFNL